MKKSWTAWALNSCSYRRRHCPPFSIDFILSFILWPKQTPRDTKYNNCCACDNSLEWLARVSTTPMATTSCALQIAPVKCQFIQSTLVFAELVAASRINPFLIDVYCNQNLYAKFGINTILSWSVISSFFINIYDMFNL